MQLVHKQHIRQGLSDMTLIHPYRLFLKHQNIVHKLDKCDKITKIKIQEEDKMRCEKCGAEINDDAILCLSCGAAVSEAKRVHMQYGGRQLTKKEFYKLPEMKANRTNINACGIMLYVLGAINIGLSVYTGDLPADGILMILLGLGIHLGKSRVCAILSLIYGAGNLVIVFLSTGRIGGWIILLIAIDAITYTFRFNKAWNQYKKSSMMPV